MKKLVFCFVLLWSLNGFAQDRIYFDCGFYSRVQKGCNYAEVIKEETYWRLNYYNCLGQLIKAETRKSTRDFSNENLDGLSIIYNYNGSVYSQGNYAAGLKQGIWIQNERDSSQNINSYTSDIKTKTIKLSASRDTTDIIDYNTGVKNNIYKHLKKYNNGRIEFDRWFDTKGQDSITYYYSNNETKVINTFDSVRIKLKESKVPEISTQMPRFVGDQEALDNLLADNLIYPPSLFDSEVCGVVYLSFTITELGEIIDIKAINAQQDPLFEKEAIRVIALTKGKWISGKQNGLSVSTKCQIPIEFSIL